jgi:HAD superfamily hydrolase (TIGR01549 family)
MVSEMNETGRRLAMGRHKVITGRIVNGVGKAAAFTQMDWVRGQCREKLGFDPYPGTLNLEVTEADASVLEGIWARSCLELVPPMRGFCTGKVIPACVGDIQGAILLPEASVRVHGARTLEVIAPVRIKDALGLKEGDVLSLTVRGTEPRTDGSLKVETVIFDLDGTLVDSTDAYFRLVEMTLDHLGLPSVEREHILRASDNGDFDWSLVLPSDLSPEKTLSIRKQAWARVRAIYPSVFEETVQLFPGVVDVIREIAAMGMRMGIVTSTPRVNMAHKVHLLREGGIEHHFEALITADDAPRKKPDPDPLIACIRTLGSPAEKSLYVGDTRSDIRAGKAAGMKTAAVLTGFDSPEMLINEAPNLLLPSVADLIEKLERVTPCR